MKRAVLALTLALAMLISPAAVTIEELSQSRFYTQTSTEALVEFITNNGLSEENFSMSYLNTSTGELISFNERTLMLAGSTYKLPLCMLYVDMLAQGTLTEDQEISAVLTKTLEPGETLPEGATIVTPSPQPSAEASADPTTETSPEASATEYTITATGIVGELVQLALVDSDNDSAELLLRYAYEGQGYNHYLDRISVYGDYDFSGFDRELLYQNYFPADYMMGCLKYLFEHAATYVLVTDYLKTAQPGMYFRSYISDEVAHKYGFFNGAVNDVGIIYTETPFLLVCFTYGLTNGEQVVGRLAELMAEYTNYTTAHDQYVAEQIAAGAEIPENSDSPEPEEPSPTPMTEEERIDQLIAEIEALETAPVTTITPPVNPEPTPEPASEPEELASPQPEEVEPEEEDERGFDPVVIICAVVIVLALAIVILLILGSRGRKKGGRRGGKHAARR